MSDTRNRECPTCGETKLTSFDALGLRWSCEACHETWRNRPGRHVPSTCAPRLPCTTVMVLDTELPEPTTRKGAHR